MTHQHDDDLDDELPPHLRQLLHDGSDGPPMSAATSERLLGRVLVSVGAAAAATATVAGVTNVSGTGAVTTAAATTATSAATTATTTAATAGLGVAMKAAIVAAVVGVAGVVGVVAVRQPASPIPAVEVPVASSVLQPPPAAVPVEVAPVEVAPVEVAPVEVAPVAVAPVEVAPVAVVAPKVKPAPSTERTPAGWELPMLEQARAALSAGRPEEALALVEDHQRRAPASPLLEESAAVRVMALSRAGRIDEATTAATAFLRRWPESLFGERVRQVLR